VIKLYGAPPSRRSDARRNRAAILAAAGDVLTAQGSEVPMPEIARRAGVGQATLYRHFPDRRALTAAVIQHRLEQLEAAAAACVAEPATFRPLVREVLRTLVAMRPVVTLARSFDPGQRDLYTRRVLAALSGPLRSAQDSGLVRRDLEPADLLVVLAMVMGVTDAGDVLPAAHRAADRSIDLVLDGVFRTDA
jgi:AcrR family transcriptional regulator